jgi:hypothetical protein
VHWHIGNRRIPDQYLGKPGLGYTSYISARGGSNIMQHQGLALGKAQHGGFMSGNSQARLRGLVRA